MLQRLLRLTLAGALCLFASLAPAQTPQYRSAATYNGAGTVTFPAGSLAADWLVMSVVSTAAVSTPANWTQRGTYTSTAGGYRAYLYTRQKGSDSSVTVFPNNGGTLIVAYSGVDGIGSVGTYAESTNAANTLTLNGITPQHANSRVLGIVTDGQVATFTAPGTFTSRLTFNTTYFANNLADRAYGSTSPTGTPVWAQGTGAAAVGIQIELRPLMPPGIANAFGPATIISGASSTLTFTVSNTNTQTLSSINFSDALANMTLASPALGGTCGGVTNSPALATGAASLNLTLASLPAGSCTITVQVVSSTAGMG